MFNSDKALEALKLARRLSDNLSNAQILNYSGHACLKMQSIIHSGITSSKVDKIDEIERKLDALIELLGVKEVSCETIEPKLVKGKKEVSLSVKK